MPRYRGLVTATNDVGVMYRAVHYNSVVINRCRSNGIDWACSRFLIVNLFAAALKRAAILEKNCKNMAVGHPGDFAVFADVSVRDIHACVGHVYGCRAGKFDLSVLNLIFAATR